MAKTWTSKKNAGFEIRATYPMEDDFSEKDEMLRSAANPIKSSFSGCGACRDRSREGREIGFEVSEFEEALGLKERLEQVPIDDLVVIIREL